MQKYNNYIITILLLQLSFVGCVKDTLDKTPKLSFFEENAFENFEICQTYAFGFYSVFPGYNVSLVNEDFNGDLMMNNNSTVDSDWIWNRVTVPTDHSSWNFGTIRRANIMLRGLEKSPISEIDKDHWRSIAMFFRAYDYIDKISKFSDVPWIDRVLETDDELLYAPRTPRDEVSNHILNDLIYARDHIIEPGTKGIVPNSISRDVVLALISRYGLFEGTWRKYHGLGGEQKYLQASLEASSELMEKHPDLHESYDEVFNSENLSGMKGILFYQQYELGILQHVLTSRHRNSAGNWDLTKKAADMYLMADGETRWNSELFDGDQDPYDEFRNRDRRMYYTITPPFRVKRVTNDRFAWEYEDDPKHREYIDLMREISTPLGKYLPSTNHAGFILSVAPHYRDFNEGIPYNASRTGYKLFKYYNRITDVQNTDHNDAPIFRMGEVLLNHAEASWELGLFDQSVADATINKLRSRAFVAPFLILDISNDFDPTRDPEIDPILWEIRRERAIELMAEGFRFDDLRRWKKMKYTDAPKLGRWIKAADVKKRIPIENDAEEGYISWFGIPPAFEEYQYLYPLPSNDLVLNPQLVQNEGWE